MVTNMKNKILLMAVLTAFLMLPTVGFCSPNQFKQISFHGLNMDIPSSSTQIGNDIQFDDNHGGDVYMRKYTTGIQKMPYILILSAPLPGNLSMEEISQFPAFEPSLCGIANGLDECVGTVGKANSDMHYDTVNGMKFGFTMSIVMDPSRTYFVPINNYFTHNHNLYIVAAVVQTLPANEFSDIVAGPVLDILKTVAF